MHKLIEQAVRLRPLLRDSAARTERTRRLDHSVLEAFHAAGAFRLQLGTQFGGPAADPVTYLRVIEEYCRGDGSSGWCAMVGTESAACVNAFLAPTVTRDMLAHDPRATVAFTVVGNGKAIRENDRYRVSGRWRFASGCRHADWLSALCVVYEGEQALTRDNGAPLTTVVFVRAKDALLHDTWHTSGLCGTASDDFEFVDVMVPREFTFDIAGSPRDEAAAWRLPIGVRLAMSKAAAVCGMARGAMDSLLPLLERTPFAGALPAREEPRIQTMLAEAGAMLDGGRAYLYHCVEAAWAKALAGADIDLTDIADLRLGVVWSARQAVAALHLMQELAGTGAILDHAFDRYARDIEVARHHMQLQTHVLEDVGRVRLGLAPRSPFF